ncbi:hypothetical protein Back11_35650 [Paenibacillus baekrokdamisoli]|uniref:Uncharacterized protein n=1 Tax=Paenibacillus baekrokdamisoli TaxID=1712516 RepID=A0A3G9ITM4_9BACL|nr:class I SAM-dependent methyltransferase [Paenibacillus baekrokdamisoli]MBB3070842.1 2-polyprenyl-3-methyl-5-hydroxy-6-metoxy-1,4-benzoquinol methylase [Paenibacillus baekrokdamisoli]BBH22220.1 hypothetical protein Back11_35650 [Paenibacillus baekrokdamisoli]
MRTQEHWFDLMLTTTTDLLFDKETQLLSSYYERNLVKKASVLDVGCGNGAYLLRMSQQFPLWSCTGIEMNEQIYRFAQTKVSKAITIVPTAYQDYHSPKPYDYVLVRLIAAHLPDLAHFMRWLRERIHPGSIIIIIDVEEEMQTELTESKLLPLFSNLYQQMRKPLRTSKLMSFKDLLSLEAVYAGLHPIERLNYGVTTDSPSTREQIYNYMRHVTGAHYGSAIPPERDRELAIWYESRDESFAIRMFGLVLQLKT